MFFNGFLLLLFVFILDLLGCRCSLQVTRISVPPHVKVGESGWLECEYQSEGDRLYSLSWYLGQAEFYRWMPKDSEPVKVFKIDSAFKIDPYQSRDGKVQIHEVSLLASGILRCEVSGEGPHFHTDFKEAKLRVIDPPDSRPVIDGVLPEYQSLQDINLNCTSARSNPPANLTLYINDQPVSDHLLIRYPTKLDYSTDLETSVLGVHLIYQDRLIKGHQKSIRVKCVASIEDVYWESSEVILKLPTHNLYSSRVAAGAQSRKGIAWPLPWRLLPILTFILIFVCN